MINEKRYVRGYKVKPSIYKKAMSRAKKEKGALANIVENVVMAYAYGLDIKAIKINGDEGTARALDIFSENFAITLNELPKQK